MFQIIFALIGSFIGAGFASGKEIFNFFTIYSYSGIISIFIFSLLLFLLIKKCFYLKIKLNISQYSDLLDYFDRKYVFFNSRIFSLFINTFLLASFYTMISALSTLFRYQFDVAKIITIFLTILICYPIFLHKNIRIIYTINSILIPILIAFLFFLFFSHTDWELITIFSLPPLQSGKGFFMGLFYFSYNSLLLIPLIFNLNLNKKEEKKITKISAIFSCIIFLMTLFLNFLLFSHFFEVSTIDLPLLHILNGDNFILVYMYFFTFLSAIFTTIISSGYSFINNLNSHHFHLKLLLFLMVSFLFSLFSFSSLINFFYPLFGFFGFFQLILLFQ